MDMPNWSEEHFLVESSKQSLGHYKLNDKLGEKLTGAWFREEVQPIEKINI